MQQRVVACSDAGLCAGRVQDSACSLAGPRLLVLLVHIVSSVYAYAFMTVSSLLGSASVEGSWLAWLLLGMRACAALLCTLWQSCVCVCARGLLWGGVHVHVGQCVCFGAPRQRTYYTVCQLRVSAAGVCREEGCLLCMGQRQLTSSDETMIIDYVSAHSAASAVFVGHQVLPGLFDRAL
jgi:hypothetical protein